MGSVGPLRLVFGLMPVLLLLAGCSEEQGESITSLVRKIDWLRSTHEYGHTCIKIQTDEQVIYLDPVDLVGIEELPQADIILITHHHPDHLSPRTITALSKESTVVVSSDSPLITQAIGEANVFALAPGEKASLGGLEVEAVAAYGSSGHTRELRGLGFAFAINGVRIYCSGDTGLTPEIKSLSNVDIAVLNVRQPYALSGEDVVEFAEVVKPGVIIPIHWMPDKNTYRDGEEIEYIRKNIPNTTLLSLLELK
jgi:L-ascorbate metabolism protein UlaG (beta-lactamase superfamily)